MAKLYFNYGVMSSGKSNELLQLAYNYKKQKREVLLLSPSTNTRDGNFIKSRTGLSQPAETLLSSGSIFSQKPIESALTGLTKPIIIIDEAQFLPPLQVDELASLVDKYGINVWCFGLKVDAFSKMFPGSQRLLELADKVDERKTICRFCDRKATQHLRVNDGKVVKSGSQVQVGGDDNYYSVCRTCWVSFKDGEVM